MIVIVFLFKFLASLNDLTRNEPKGTEDTGKLFNSDIQSLSYFFLKDKADDNGKSEETNVCGKLYISQAYLTYQVVRWLISYVDIALYVQSCPSPCLLTIIANERVTLYPNIFGG